MAAKEVPQELVDRVFEAVEVAKSTGKVSKGTNETTKAIEKGKAKMVVVAKDVTPPEVVMHIPAIAEEKGIPCFQVPAKEDLGAAAGLQVGTGSVAITAEGESKDIIKELTEKIK